MAYGQGGVSGDLCRCVGGNNTGRTFSFRSLFLRRSALQRIAALSYRLAGGIYLFLSGGKLPIYGGGYGNRGYQVGFKRFKNRKHKNFSGSCLLYSNCRHGSGASHRRLGNAGGLYRLYDGSDYSIGCRILF